LAFLAIMAGLFMAAAPHAAAQVAVSIGAAPICPYGYYEVPPYNCTPDGYYGPEWFSGGIFIGAGPWYHGSGNFYGHVDHHLDFRKGYRGQMPARAASTPPNTVRNFMAKQCMIRRVTRPRVGTGKN
jgi:hypothetical protein